MIAVSRHLKHIFSFSSRVGFISGLIPKSRSLPAAGKTIHSQYTVTNCLISFPVGFPWIFPFVGVLGKIFNRQSFSTHTSADEERLGDELNQIIATIENAPSFSCEMLDAYIDKLCTFGSLSAAYRLLQSLREKQIFLSPKAYHSLLRAASERGEIKFFCQVFKDNLALGKPLSLSSYMNLAKTFIKANDFAQLQIFVKEVSEATFPSSTVVNRIIFAFAKCKEIEMALQIFSQMKSLKCTPDLYTYNTILDMLGRAGYVDEMLCEFASMKEVGIDPDVISYNTLLNSLRKVGRLDLCLIYFREMSEKGIEPDLFTYTALIECYGRTGNIKESLRLFMEMKHKHIRPSIYIYRSLIDNLKKIGNVGLATTFLEEMNSCHSSLAGPRDFKSKKTHLTRKKKAEGHS